MPSRPPAIDTPSSVTQLAAAWAADGLQQLLDVIAASQHVTPNDVDRLAGPATDELRAARQAFVNAIGKVDILLQLLDALASRRSRSLADCAGAPVRVSRDGPRSRDRQQPGCHSRKRTQVDVEHMHLVLSPIELDILVDALRSVGNVEFTERLETSLRQGRQPPAG